MSDKVIDARGLSCPEPVLLAHQAAKENPKGGFQVVVTSTTAKDNVFALLEDKGFAPSVEDNADEWLITVPAK